MSFELSSLIVPEVVENKARLAGSSAWIDDLRDLVGNACERWGLEVEGVLDGGTEALVLAVSRADAPAVLKLCVPRSDDSADVHRMARAEIDVLTLAGGQGSAELYESDASQGLLLLERLGPSLADLGLPLTQRHHIMCAAATAMWHCADRPSLERVRNGFMSGADKGRWLIGFIAQVWERTGRPCSEAVISHALECAERRVAAHDDERSVLVHGDVHQWNTLRTLDGSGYRLIDPDGLLAEREYDLGIIMREDPGELLDDDPHERSRRLASLTGCDEPAIWEWGVVERVSTGLLCVEIDLQPIGTEMLATAESVVGR